MWNLLLPSIASIAGAVISSSANTAAAEKASASSMRAAEIQAQAIREGNAQAQQTLQSLRTEAAPAGAYLRSVVAEPGELTPVQQAQLEENRRATANQIHSSNFAGSGRTAAALFKKSEADFTNQALENNRQRALTAAGGMYGASTNAATGIANSQANSATAIGKAYSDAESKSGLYEAQADLASGKLYGQAIGTIGSTIANEARESRYADRLKGIEKSLGIG